MASRWRGRQRLARLHSSDAVVAWLAVVKRRRASSAVVAGLAALAASCTSGPRGQAMLHAPVTLSWMAVEIEAKAWMAASLPPLGGILS